MDLTSYTLSKKYADKKVSELTGLDFTDVNNKMVDFDTQLKNTARIPIGQVFIAVNNQTVFYLSNSYEIGSNTVAVEIDGVPQKVGEGYIESSTTSITLTEPLPAGAIVKVTVFETPIGVETKVGEAINSVAELNKAANEYEWTTTEGQVTYILPSGQSYNPDAKWLEVRIGGAPVPLSQIQMDSPTQFTLLVDSSVIPANVKVVARWAETYVPATAGHHTKHELGGQDEIDITKLKNYQSQVADQFTNVSSQLADMASISIYLALEGFLFDGSDESVKLQTILDANSGKRINLFLPQTKTLTVKNITYTGTLVIHGFYSKISGNVGDYVFKNKTNSAAILIVRDLELSKIGLVDFELDGTAQAGTKIWVDNLIAYGDNQQGTLIKTRSNDFMNVKNLYVYDYDTVFDIQSNVPTDRMNTQIHLENIAILQCHYGLKGAGISKLTINGFDINKCTIGLWFNIYVSYALINNFHCENYGYYGVSGYGIYINNYALNRIKFQCCDIQLPATNAVNGIYLPPTTTVNTDTNTIEFEHVYVDKITGKKALQLDGRFTWKGKWDYTNTDVGLYGSFNKVLNGKIIPTDNHYQSRNLLSVSKVVALTDFQFKEGTGDCDITTVNGQTMLTNNTAGDIKYSLKFKSNHSGWYTVLFNGDLMDDSNIVRIKEDSSPYSSYMTSSCRTVYDYQTNRFYFYYDGTNWLRIEFTVKVGKSIKISDVGAYEGFKTEF